MELEFALDALDKQMKVLANELAMTESARVSGFLANLTGTKQKQIDRIHALQDELNLRRGQMTQMMETLNQEITALSEEAREAAEKKSRQESQRDQRRREIESSGGEQAEQLAKCRGEFELCEFLLNKLKSALDACEEARRDLLSEVETASSLGRNPMLKANRALKMIANHVRKGAREDCAGRVRQSLTRLNRKLEEMLKVNTNDRELDSMSNEIAFYVGTFSGSDLNGNATLERSTTLLHDRLQVIAMTLEQRIVATQLRLTDARKRHDELLDSAPATAVSLGGDAIQVTPPAQK